MVSGVPPGIAGAALNRLNIAKLCNSAITTSQLEAILRYAFNVLALHSLLCFDIKHRRKLEKYFLTCRAYVVM